MAASITPRQRWAIPACQHCRMRSWRIARPKLLVEMVSSPFAGACRWNMSRPHRSRGAGGVRHSAYKAAIFFALHARLRQMVVSLIHRAARRIPASCPPTLGRLGGPPQRGPPFFRQRQTTATVRK
jgi:hypothetical protein